MRLIDELNDLHAIYVEAVNTAVGFDDSTRVESLATEYDDAALHLIAEREGKTPVVPITRGAAPETPMRRLAARLRAPRAA